MNIIDITERTTKKEFLRWAFEPLLSSKLTGGDDIPRRYDGLWDVEIEGATVDLILLGDLVGASDTK